MKIHLAKPGAEKTFCNRRLDRWIKGSLYQNGDHRIEVTVHGALASCEKCLDATRREKK